ncbi:MarR family winged helix-turn-helix transcriptional regulator [Streptomyces sp. NTH33]|uniref:MarR family winged helix-turn-helix transcriptional regulator n=1 Tax=Streptomyces sp. NTH33 TaxID=1735453 RepID=UPI0021AC7CC4|nr:MarR family transcriptional regulator [Streptomyces sp. NTH33]
MRDFGLLIKAATRLEQRIDTAPRRDRGFGHTMFEVLVRLCRRPGEEVSQRDPADDLPLTSSGVTRLVDRMEEAGPVRRVPSPEDRRTVRVEPAVLRRTGGPRRLHPADQLAAPHPHGAARRGGLTGRSLRPPLLSDRHYHAVRPQSPPLFPHADVWGEASSSECGTPVVGRQKSAEGDHVAPAIPD